MGEQSGMSGAWLANMSTESFEFQAVGRTKEEAERAVARKFHELATQRMTIRELRDWYGLSAEWMEFGKARRL